MNAILLALAAVFLLTGFAPQDAPPAADEEDPEFTNVDPREPLRRPDAPELPDTPMTTMPTPAIEAPSTDQELGMPEPERYGRAKLESASGSDVSGTLNFHEDGGETRIRGKLEGLEPGRHALHVHVSGDCSAADASSAGGHFAPDDDPHGDPGTVTERHHVGDLGNIVADDSGVAEIDKTDAEMTLGSGDNTILDRAVIVHARADDMESQPAGAAGDRIACGVVNLEVAPAY